MHSVPSQQNKDHEVRNQQGAIERIGVIEALKSLVQ